MIYSSLLSRLIASCLDWFLIFFPLMIFYMVGLVITIFNPLLYSIPLFIPLYSPFLFLLYFSYKVFFECSALMATPGKRIMGIKVVDPSGKRLTFKASAIRFFIGLLSSSFFFLGHFLALFTDKKQALHDLIAKSVVIIGKEDGSLISSWINSIKDVINSNSINLSPSKAQDSETEENLNKLLQKGVISQEEYDKLKNRTNVPKY